MSFQGPRRLIGHVAQRFNHVAHVGQSFWTHTIAAIDDAGNSRGADACFPSYLAESWMRVIFGHLVSALIRWSSNHKSIPPNCKS
jgi:hypothetical protein